MNTDTAVQQNPNSNLPPRPLLLLLHPSISDRSPWWAQKSRKFVVDALSAHVHEGIAPSVGHLQRSDIMSPPRTILILLALVIVPTLLTFLSLRHSHPHRHAAHESHEELSTQTSIRTFFSFHTPATLFPPSAIISLTDDNSTFFLARPADFGPSLTASGLSGQLWIGSGFGDDGSGRGGADTGTEGELGCSDVPGWDEFSKIYIGKDSVIDPTGFHNTETTVKDDRPGQASEDGTDDHLHHPLPSSGVSKPSEPGQPAEHEDAQNGASATHGDIQSLQESAEISGKVVLLSRGGCGFLEKVKWAQRRGATALIVGDHTRGGALVTMYARGDTSNVSIPSLFTSHTTAHLLSSLIPIENPTSSGELEEDRDDDSQRKGSRVRGSEADVENEDDKPTFTQTPSTRATVLPRVRHYKPTNQHIPSEQKVKRGWLKSIFRRSRTSHVLEDSTRPPSSGRLDWWSPSWTDTSSTDVKAKLSKDKSKTKHPWKDNWWPGSHSTSSDDFVIGVQDWRDPDLVATQTSLPKSTTTSTTKLASSTASIVSRPGKGDGSDNLFSGGSITPGSGRYNNPSQKIDAEEQTSAHDREHQIVPPGASDKDRSSKTKAFTHVKEVEEEHEGLWVTLTPTKMSTSPFFDTLLVLVVSPLVTLTVVYALLLLRSRIRRRRWRAPKSVVDRLPIRTYHTMSASTTTSSTRFASPNTSNPNSPLLQSSAQSIDRVRTRAATATGVSEAVSHSLERATTKHHEKLAVPRKYHGKQIECVVCLEEYVDGKSKVMSLPCGHEFHAECM